MFTTSQYLTLLSVEEMIECNLLGQVLSSFLQRRCEYQKLFALIAFPGQKLE